MKIRGGALCGLGGLWLGEFTCNLAGVAVGVDIPNSVELVSEVAVGTGLGIGGMRAGAELDWRRKLELEEHESAVQSGPCALTAPSR